MTTSSWYDAGALAAKTNARLEQIVGIRHDIHKHPELGFEETRTQALVTQWLQKHGYEPRPCAETGVLADLRPDLVGKAPTIALRADLDCLPMQETTDLPYRSVHDGRAHKCGHDGHTAVLLGVASLLAEHRDAVPGNVRLIFQPAEEGVRGGGARVMVAQGALRDVAEVYGLHNWPEFPRGEIRVQPGPLMAQPHRLEISITGKGGHGSQPHVCRDPILAGSHLVVALQSVVARGLSHHGGGVVSICEFHAGTTSNVIPGGARLSGTMRSFEPAVRDRLESRIREICQGTAAAFGVEVDVEIHPGYPVLNNDANCAAAVARVAERLFGPASTNRLGLPVGGAEDFAYFTEAVAGAYFLVGAGEGDDAHVCHHPDFDFDDTIIARCISMFLGIVADRFEALAG